MTPSDQPSTPRRGTSHKPRRIQLLQMFYWKAGLYVLLSLATFLLGAYAMLRSTDNRSYVIVGSFLVLVLISNLLSKKFIRLLRRYGNQ
jgi:uncharacterized membrane protein